MKAIILLSGGLDSAVILGMAMKTGRECHALSFDYGQKHRVELKAAEALCNHYQIKQHIIKIDPTPFKTSSLVSELEVPKNRTLEQLDTKEIPSTYVPARNTIFLAYALGFAEHLNADEIYFGSNAMDLNGYCDCRPTYIQAFQNLMNLATKQAVEGHPPRLVTPLLNMDKTEIVKQGKNLGVPLHLTISCYNPSAESIPCQICDACLLRAHGFSMQSSQ